jgi:hypothetical protein
MTTFTLQDLTVPKKEPRSFWNHRVVRMPPDGLEGEWLEIQEVYYNEQNEPCGYCAPCLGSETLEGLQLQVERFAECLTQPILNAETDFNNKWGHEDEKDL